MQKVINKYKVYEVKFDDDFNPGEWCEEHLADDEWMAISYNTVMAFGAQVHEMSAQGVLKHAFSVEEFQQSDAHLPLSIEYSY